MTFQIRTGVALPPRSRVGGTSKYPLAQLEIDQSFFVPNATKATGVTLSKLAKALQISITTRQAEDFAEYDDEGNGVGEKAKGLMVWRIAPPAPKA